MKSDTCSVDGEVLNKRSLRDWSAWFDEPRAGEVSVLPGLHTITVSYRRMSGGDLEESTQDAVLSIVAEAGHIYEVQAQRIKKQGWEEIRHEFFGGWGSWTAWVIDTATGQVVAGRPPPR
jgi:hypothetical protein